MRWRMSWLVFASICQGVVWAFSVHDDLFAFPQYEVVFSDKYVSEEEAKVKLAIASTASLGSSNDPGSEQSHGDSDLSRWSSPDSTLPQEESTQDSGSRTYERMILKNHTYLCSIPQPQPPKNETKEEIAPEEEEKELQRATDRGWELLKGMKGNCIYYQSGWWSYSLCYQTEVKQFHPLAPPKGAQAHYPPVEDPRVPSFLLGEFKDPQDSTKHGDGKAKKAGKTKPEGNPKSAKSDSSALAIRKKGDTRYLVQHLGGGSTCDLTGKPRKVEVQFHCHPQSADRIGWIKETATCSYLMIVYTPRLCKDVAFLPPKEHKAAPIVCSEVLSESQVAAWHARQASRMEDLLLGGGVRSDLSSAAAPIRPVVGGIEVGGMKEVGAEGQRISPPQVVEHAPKEGEVIAQWDPKRRNGVIEMLPDEDLRELGLDPDLVDRTKDEIHRGADGRPWKLEFVDLGNGVHELVGVVETGDGDEEPADEGKDDAAHGEDREHHDEEEHKEEADGQAKHGRKGQRGQRGSKERFKDEL